MSRVAVTPMLNKATANGDSTVIELMASRWSIHSYGVLDTATLTVYTSSDGVNWIADGTIASLPSLHSVLLSNQPVITKYVKLVITGAGASTSISSNIQQEVLA